MGLGVGLEGFSPLFVSFVVFLRFLLFLFAVLRFSWFFFAKFFSYFLFSSCSLDKSGKMGEQCRTRMENCSVIFGHFSHFCLSFNLPSCSHFQLGGIIHVFFPIFSPLLVFGPFSMFLKETTKDPEVEGSRSYQNSVTPLFKGYESSQNTCFTVLQCNQRGAADPRPISTDFLNP